MPRWLETIVRSVVAGGATGAWAAVVGRTGCSSVLILFGAILIVFAVSSYFRKG